METVLLVTLIIAAPFLSVISLVFSELERKVLVPQEKEEIQVVQELKKAA